MTKKTVYLNNFVRKMIYITISEAVCFLNSPLLEKSDDLSIEEIDDSGTFVF